MSSVSLETLMDYLLPDVIGYLETQIDQNDTTPHMQLLKGRLILYQGLRDDLVDLKITGDSFAAFMEATRKAKVIAKKHHCSLTLELVLKVLRLKECKLHLQSEWVAADNLPKLVSDLDVIEQTLNLFKKQILSIWSIKALLMLIADIEPETKVIKPAAIDEPDDAELKEMAAKAAALPIL